MRVTTNTFPRSLAGHLNELTARQLQLQEQAASGQRIRLPHEDPAAVHRVLTLEEESRVLDRYQSNIANLRDRAQATYSVLRDLKNISDRAGELAILADDTRSPADLKTYAVEVAQLIKRAVQLANTRWNGEYLFAGTRTDQAPFTATEDSAGEVVSVSFQGNSSVAESAIADGVTLSAHTLGSNSTGGGPRGLFADTRFGADLFNHLIAFHNHLVNGDTAAIASIDRIELAKDEENLLTHVSANGVLQARLETTNSAAVTRHDAVEGLISREADADLAQTLVHLNQAQTAYQAALQSGAQLLRISLLDFIR